LSYAPATPGKDSIICSWAQHQRSAARGSDPGQSSKEVQLMFGNAELGAVCPDISPASHLARRPPPASVKANIQIVNTRPLADRFVAIDLALAS